MKNILVPTDFSENANNALRFAINIANYFESTIHLVHVYNIPQTVGMVGTVVDFMEGNAEDELGKIKAEFDEFLLPKTIMRTISITGFTDSAITNHAKTIGADLIVMGTQGATGLKSVFLGSNAAAVITSSSTPVLMIPNDCSYRPFDKITLAIDDESIADEAIINPVLQLAKAYESHVNILHVEKNLEEDTLNLGIDEFLREVPHTFNTVYKDDVKKGIDEFVTVVNADLLCLIHRNRGLLESLFHESVILKEAFDSPVPLLVVYERI